MKNALLLILVLFCLSCAGNHSLTKSKLPRSTPEKEGVDSKGIFDFLEALKEKDFELHSFMILRHGNVISEGWAVPYSDTLNHTLFSVTKTFTSTAIGFAVSENLLSVDDKVIKFFPESLPDTVSPYLASLTVKHLLTMSTGQDPEPRLSILDTNTVKTFLAVPIVHEPGTKFKYNSYASHILSAIVQKVSGQKIRDYLQTRLFEPLGIVNIDWTEDGAGINTGGWGLNVKTEDMAKLGQLYLRKGKWNGKRLLPESWIEEATTKKIEQRPDATAEEKEKNDWEQGYGYQIWRNLHGYRADGMAGQFIIVLPEQDMVIALTANIPDMQQEIACIWKHILPAVQEEVLPPNPVNLDKIKSITSEFDILLPGGSVDSPIEKEISGKLYKFAPNKYFLEDVKVVFNEDKCHICFNERTWNQHLHLGKGKWYASGSCVWEDEHTLLVRIIDMDMSAGDYTFKFEGDSITASHKNMDVSGKIAGS